MPGKTTRKKTSRKKDKAITRRLTHPETGEEIVLYEHDEYPEIFRYMSKVMYISGSYSITQISAKLGIPANTLRTWQTRDSWMALKREVNRLATQDAVRQSRRAMSKYIVEIDRSTNSLLHRLNERLQAVEDKDKLHDEGDIIKHIADMLRLKLLIVRILSYGTESRGFTPHPADLAFDGSKEKGSVRQLMMNEAEVILDNIPEYLKRATEFVLGVETDNIDPALLDAVAQQIDLNKNGDEEEDEDDDNDTDNFI